MSFLTDLSQAKSQCTMLCVNFYSFCYNTSTPTWLEPTFPTLFPTILQQELHTPDKLFPEHALCIPASIAPHRLHRLSGRPFYFSPYLNIISLK